MIKKIRELGRIFRIGKYFFLFSIVLVFFACGQDSNEELINDVFFASNSDSQSLPVVRTNSSVLSITTTSAQSGGVVENSGTSSLLAKGVCWNTSPSPTTNNFKTNNGNSTGSFISTLTGLTSNRKYYIRAYAINSAGTVYGSEVSFTTAMVGTPTLTTTVATSITSNSAISGGNITSAGSSSVTVRGVCWSSSPNPTITNSRTVNGTGIGSFTSNIAGLVENTTYYVKAYATNSYGTAYGNEISFVASSSSGSYPTNGIVAYYPFNGNANDLSGNSRNGTVYGSSFVDANNSKGILFSNSSNAGWYDVKDYVKLPLLSFSDFTITLWAKFYKANNYEPNGVIFSIGDNSANWFFINCNSNNGDISIDYNGTKSTTVNINDSKFHFISVIKSSSAIHLFLDNALVDSKAISGYSFVNQPAYFSYHQWYNGDGGSSRFYGVLDDVFIYNRALTSNEINKIFIFRNK